MGSRINFTTEEALAFAESMKNVDFKNQADRMAIAEVIVKELRETIERDDIISLLGVNKQTFKPGESLQFVTRKGTKAYVHEPGTFAPRSTMVNKVQTLYTELVSVHPEMEIGQLQSGRYGTIQDIKDFALNELLGRKYAIIWSTLVNSISTSASNYWAVASTAASTAKKNALDSGFDYAMDQQGSTVTAIVGRRTALSWMADYNAYSANGPSDGRKVTFDNAAYPGNYRGVPVIMLNQYTDGWSQNVIANNEIMIVGKNTIYLGIDRPLDFMEEIDVDTLMWHIHMYESYGTGVFFGERNARIKLT